VRLADRTDGRFQAGHQDSRLKSWVLLQNSVSTTANGTSVMEKRSLPGFPVLFATAFPNASIQTNPSGGYRKMRRFLLVTAVIAASFSATTIPARAEKDSDKCHNAWEDRNSVYYRKNYCFKTAKALNWFGANASDCKAKVTLTPSDEAIIKEAKRREARYC
jgi:hypothetical protein